MSEIPTQLLWAVCAECQRQHPIQLIPGNDQEMADWWHRHRGHRGVAYFAEMPPGLDAPGVRSFLRRLNPLRAARRWLQAWLLLDYQGHWQGYAPNANVKGVYVASAAYTISLASLATDTSLLAGQQSTPINNTSNLYLDYYLGGKTTTGTSPTASKLIQCFVFCSRNDTPAYPDAFSTADANRSIASVDIGAAEMHPLVNFPTSNSSNTAYELRMTSLCGLATFAGAVAPLYHGLFVVHNTGVNLHATAGNHAWSYTPVYQSVT